VDVAGGVSTTHRDGSLNFLDVISDETASTGQSGSSTFGTFGVLGTVSTPIFLPGLPDSQGFLESGILFHTDNKATATFTNFSGNEATGHTSTKDNWSVPILVGATIPVNNVTPLLGFIQGVLGNAAHDVSLQLKGGIMIDNKKSQLFSL
jgi:hypothetical protein